MTTEPDAIAPGESQMESVLDAATDSGSAGRYAELSPQEALKRLRAGEELQGVRIRRLILQGAFTAPIRMVRCHLIQPELRKATFQESVSILACQIDKLTTQRQSQFAKELRLDGSTFSRTILGGLTVQGMFSMRSVICKAQLRVTACQFQSRVDFWEARLQSWADFRDCHFAAEADFRSIEADQGLVFDRKCYFAKDLLLRGTNIEKKIQMEGCRCGGMIDLSKAKLRDFAYLEGILAGPQQTWGFLNTVADSIRVSPAQIEGRLASELAGRHHEAMQEYGLLKQCYAKLHRFDQEDWAFYRFKVAQRKSKPWSWRKPWSVWRTFFDWLFLDIGCGYGTNPLRAVRMAILIILGFALLYAAFIDKFYIDRNKLPFPEDPAQAWDNRLMVGFTTSVSVFTSGMGGIREMAQGWMNIPVMVQSLMGTLLFGLFIVAFSRKVIR